MGQTQAEDRVQGSLWGAIFRDQAPRAQSRERERRRRRASSARERFRSGSLPLRALSWGPPSWWLPSATVSLKGSSVSLADAIVLAFLFIQNSKLLNFSYCPNWSNIKKTSSPCHLKKTTPQSCFFFSLPFPCSNKTETLLFYAIRAPRLWERLPGFTGKEFGSEKPVSLPLLLAANPWQWIPNKTSFPFLTRIVDQIISFLAKYKNQQCWKE